ASDADSTPVADASVVVEGGPATRTDGAGHFSFSLRVLSSFMGLRDAEYWPVSVSVEADGYSRWTIQAARYYKSDTLRLYPRLEGADMSEQVHIAASPSTDSTPL